jgi:hypothetical protein
MEFFLNTTDRNERQQLTKVGKKNSRVCGEWERERARTERLEKYEEKNIKYKEFVNEPTNSDVITCDSLSRLLTIFESECILWLETVNFYHFAKIDEIKNIYINSSSLCALLNDSVTIIDIFIKFLLTKNNDALLSSDENLFHVHSTPSRRIARKKV